MIGIYKWTNKINGKIYIGQSINIEERSRSHISSAYYIKSNTYNTAFHAAIRKYGPQNFDFQIICLCPVTELDTLEKYYIKELNTLVPNGYNMTTGGENPRSIHCKYSNEDIKQILNELKTTDLTTEEIAGHWHCSASLIKKIGCGQEYYIDGETYPVRSQERIKQIMQTHRPRGENNTASLLTDDIVQDIIYDLLDTDETIQSLSKKYNICVDQISRINRGVAWAHIERPIPCRDTKRQNEKRALMVANLLLNTSLSQSEILKETGYKDRHTVQKINQHLIYTDLLKQYPNPIRKL